MILREALLRGEQRRSISALLRVGLLALAATSTILLVPWLHHSGRWFQPLHPWWYGRAPTSTSSEHSHKPEWWTVKLDAGGRHSPAEPTAGLTPEAGPMTDARGCPKEGGGATYHASAHRKEAICGMPAALPTAARPLDDFFTASPGPGSKYACRGGRGGGSAISLPLAQGFYSLQIALSQSKCKYKAM
jgi:hypothetical protein